MGDVASIPQRVGDLGAYLREQRENAKLSVRQLASLTGVSNPYLSQVERGLRRPSAEVLHSHCPGTATRQPARPLGLGPRSECQRFAGARGESTSEARERNIRK